MAYLIVDATASRHVAVGPPPGRHMGSSTRPLRLLLTLLCGVASAAAEDRLTCGQCIALQEGIWRSIRHNISHFEKKNTAGVVTTATLEVGQIIWHLCGSEGWKHSRPSDGLLQACSDHTRPHTDLMTEYWKEKLPSWTVQSNISLYYSCSSTAPIWTIRSIIHVQYSSY